MCGYQSFSIIQKIYFRNPSRKSKRAGPVNRYLKLSFMELLYSCHLNRGGLDLLKWSLTHSNKFEVKSFYKALLQPIHSSFPWRSVWKFKVPTRVAFSTWTAALGKILTIDNIRNRNVVILEWCCMCKIDGESVNHLLLHCPLAQELWEMVIAIFGVVWVMPKGVERLFPIASCGLFGVSARLAHFWGRKLLYQP